MATSAAAISSGSLASDGWKSRAVPAKRRGSMAGMPIEALARRDADRGIAERIPGARLNETVAATNGPDG